jgi:hypothetical protein
MGPWQHLNLDYLGLTTKTYELALLHPQSLEFANDSFASGRLGGHFLVIPKRNPTRHGSPHDPSALVPFSSVEGVP